RGYPVWVNVSNWSAGQTVQLAGEDFTVISPQERYGLYCWEAETYNGTSAYYHRETGVFLGSSYFETEFLGGTEWIWTSSDIIVTYQNLDDFHLVEYFFNPDSLVLSFILIEAVVALKLFDKKSLMDSTPRKS
ncbi:MAG: hypothetical protein ACFFFC_15185, partial [Candidatus Thorarchaeota archaeon]